MDDLYLTKEHYKIAEQNGISKELAYNRFNAGWDVMDAVTKPKARAVNKELQEKARANGIELPVSVIAGRKMLGWPEEKIVTTPVDDHRKKINHYVDIAAKNGIGKATFYARRQRGWTLEKASTEPVQKVYSRYKAI
ncbi:MULTISPECIES: hypothetical protein [unclassified Oceanobacillus]|uniref:hypothetical protein n=1 Tax=unclassified Oceanobacillus TaxID=2630292 RepID=UPI001BE9E69A|nr:MULTISPECIES: hypothetical protein [unclassified Oceanobacillus]MBT2601397.1 hypothetical protein [Oceanobacillus sp. ISL-74]MBT2653327.1 hypothetical protein [Oceanobacillus sp. ISL-73]